MKTKLLFLFIFLFLVTSTGCTNSSTSVSKSPSLQPSASPEDQSLLTYNDETISCEYNNFYLELQNYDGISAFDYLTLITQPGFNKADAIVNEDCVYVFTLGIQSDDIPNTYYNYPDEATKALFDGLFQYENSNASVTLKSDGLYEYQLSEANYTYKGKVLYIDNEKITFLVYHIGNALSSELINAFENCYSSISSTLPIASFSPSYENHLAQLDQEAEKLAASSQEITEGTLYDSITKIYSDVSITETNKNLSITINLPNSSCEDEAIAFFYIVTSICDSCSLEDNYTSVNFSMFVDSTFITTLTLIEYTSSTSFHSTSPVVFKDEYEEIILSLYSNIYSSNDIINDYEKNLESVKEKYMLD